MDDFNLKSLKKIDGEFFQMYKVTLKDIKRRKDECNGEIIAIQLKLDDLEYQKRIQEKEISLIDDLLNKKNDYD